MKFEKRPGWDWLVKYNLFDDPGEMMVFGAMSIDAALRDARQSLTASEIFGMEVDYEILAIERMPA